MSGTQEVMEVVDENHANNPSPLVFLRPLSEHNPSHAMWFLIMDSSVMDKKGFYFNSVTLSHPGFLKVESFVV